MTTAKTKVRNRLKNRSPHLLPYQEHLRSKNAKNEDQPHIHLTYTEPSRQ